MNRQHAFPDTVVEPFTVTLVTTPPSLPVDRHERLSFDAYRSLILQREAARAEMRRAS
jgi:hypothetical protein